MWRLEFHKRWWYCALCVMVVSAVTSCRADGGEERTQISVDTLLSGNRSFIGGSLAVDGCLNSNQHGLTIGKCSSIELGVPVLFSEKLEQGFRSTLLTRTMKSEIEDGRPLVVTLCGVYFQSPDGKDHWLKVDSFSIDSRSYGGGPVCSASAPSSRSRSSRTGGGAGP